MTILNENAMTKSLLYTKKNIVFLVLPALIFSFAYFLYPLAMTFYASFSNFNEFTHFLATPLLSSYIIHNFYITGIAVTLEFLLGLVLALIAAEKFRGSDFFLVLIVLPWVVPDLLLAKTWRWLLMPKYGPYSQILGSILLNPDEFTGAVWGVILADVWKCSSFIALILYGGLLGIPQDILNAARIDGATEWALFRWIKLPLLKPSITVAILFRMVQLMGIFATIYFLTWGGPGNSTQVLSTAAYNYFFKFLDPLRGYFIALVNVIIGLILSVFFILKIRGYLIR
jgi:multiple sugar transport system permease protein